jgi:uncharacterized protein (DUF1697 family)
VTKQVALLRGVNVGGKNKVPMAELRTVFESLGYTEVTTLIQSGNVMFTARAAVTTKTLEHAIADRFGVETTVVLRTGPELERVVAANPFTGGDVSKLHVGFFGTKPTAAVVRGFDAARFEPEEFAVHGREVYFHLPDGMGRAKLPPALDRQLKVPVTVRNWNTVTKLVALTRA